MKIPNWSKFAATGVVVATIIAALSDATTVLTNAKSMMAWLPSDTVTAHPQSSQQNLLKLTAIPASAGSRVPAMDSRERAASSVVSKDVTGVAIALHPETIRHKLMLGLPVEFTPDLSLVVHHVYGVDSQYTVGLQSPAWGNEVLELKPGGEPFEVTVSHITYEIRIRDVRADAQGNTFVDVTARQHPYQLSQSRK